MSNVGNNLGRNLGEQARAILRAISEKPGILNYELVSFALKYSSRISELRSAGYNIVATRVTKGTWSYRLVVGE